MKLGAAQPQACTAADLDSFCKLVVMGDQVDPSGLHQRVLAAHTLVFLREGNTLAGIAAIKKPGKSYRRAVFKKADVLDEGFELELGWVVVAAAYRGRNLSHHLVEAAVSLVHDPLFATSRTDNAPMHKTLKRCGFARAGSPYPGIRPEEQIALFLRARQPPAAE